MKPQNIQRNKHTHTHTQTQLQRSKQNSRFHSIKLTSMKNEKI